VRALLTAVFAATAAALVPASAAAAPNGFTTDGETLYALDAAIPSVQAIGPIGPPAAPAFAFARASGGTLYSAGGTGGEGLHRLDTSTGASSPVGDFGDNESLGLTFDSSGSMWLAAADQSGMDTAFRLYGVDPATAALSPVGGPLPRELWGIAGACDGSVYGAALDSGGWDLVRVNTATAALTTVGPMSHPQLDDVEMNIETLELAFEHSTGTLWALATDKNLYVVDAATGALTLRGTVTGDPPGSLEALAFDSTAACPATTPPTGGDDDDDCAKAKRKLKRAKKKLRRVKRDDDATAKELKQAKRKVKRAKKRKRRACRA
jgi:hypothetical protein